MNLSIAEWEAMGRKLFGDNKAQWRFQCPACGNVISVESAKRDFDIAKLGAAHFSVEQECVGRAVPGIGCDWAAYGLFHGPLFVGDSEPKHPIFDFAGLPFTGNP